METKEIVLPMHIIAVGGIVLNEKGEVLLVKHHHNGWSFPGGIVEVGENLPDALKREVMEETGVGIEVGELLCVSSNTGKHPGYGGVKEVPTKLMLDFLCAATGGTPRPSEENAESAYFSVEEARRRIEAPAVVERFRAYLDCAGRPTYLDYVTKPVFVLKGKRLI